MKNYSRVLSWQSLENNYWFIKVGERSEPRKLKKKVFLTTKYEQIVKLEHLLCPKVEGGGTNPLVPPPPLLKVGRHVPPSPFLLRPCIFSLVTTAGKFNRERLFWSLDEFLQILRQICYSVLLARHCVSFITAGQRNRNDFLSLIRLQSIQTHGPRSILVRKAWVKWIFSHLFNLRK